MTTYSNIILSEIDPEDLGDTLLKLEKSFGIRLAENSMKDANTFGDICDIIEKHINLADKEDCTSQQAFYKVRKAISLTQLLNERDIKPETSLATIFPRPHRRRNITHFERTLGFKVNILAMKNWVVFTILAGFILSLITLFFSAQYAVAGLFFFTLFTWIANKCSKELNVSTVRQLTEKVSREHYSLARRQSGTMNKSEIAKTIQDVFIADYSMHREDLTREASLGWS